jgi:hypothetical protein
VIGRARFPDRLAGNLKAAMFGHPISQDGMPLSEKYRQISDMGASGLDARILRRSQRQSGPAWDFGPFLDVGKSGVIDKNPRRLVKGRIPRRIG